MRYRIVFTTPPQDRTEHASMTVGACDDPRRVQELYDENTRNGVRVQVSNNYLRMDETFLFERGGWR